MHDLVAFINARYAERERLLRQALTMVQAQHGTPDSSGGLGHKPISPRPESQLDDLAMKRRILDEHKMAVERQPRFPFDPYTGRPSVEAFDVTCSACGWASDDPTSACTTVRLLGSEFEAHPEYQARWKP